jgi:hypothetical protein
LSLKNQKDTQSIVAIAILTAIKPHFVVMALIFVIRGRFKSTVSVVGLAGLVNIVPFILMGPQSFPANVIQWFTRFLSYQEYSSVTLQWPQNMSFSQGLYSLVFVISKGLNTNLDAAPSFIAASQGSIGLIVLVVTVLGLSIWRSRFSDQHLGIILVSLITMTSGTSFYYYGVFAAPALLALMASNSKLAARGAEADITRRINIILWCALIGTHIQLPMFLVQQTNDVVVTSATLVGFTWIMAYAAIFAAIFWTKLTKIPRK